MVGLEAQLRACPGSHRCWCGKHLWGLPEHGERSWEPLGAIGVGSICRDCLSMVNSCGSHWELSAWEVSVGFAIFRL